MEDVKIEKAMLLYNCGGEAVVIDHPGRGRRRDLKRSVGACFSEWSKMSKAQRLQQLYFCAWSAVVRDGVDPQVMHKALLVIPEYRQSIAIDVDGAE